MSPPVPGYCARMVDWPDTRTLSVVLYDRFDLLDVTGPLHAFGMLKNVFEPRLVADEPGPVRSAQGPSLVAEHPIEGETTADLLLVPGGSGAREMARNEDFLAWLAQVGPKAELVLSTSTGAALLARAGLLNGHRATTGTRALAWVSEQGPRAVWITKARWVDDGPVVTAAGVGAGIDMALHVITRLCGDDVGVNVARSLEHDWSPDDTRDPFAEGHWTPRDSDGSGRHQGT